MGKENLIPDQSSIESFFSYDRLLGWAEEIKNCKGLEEHGDLLPLMRKITLHPNYRSESEKIYKKNNMIYGASYEDIPGIDGSVPRELTFDLSMVTPPLFLSRIIDHKLEKEDLEKLYKHHFIEPVIRMGKALKFSTLESIRGLDYYLKRVSNNYFNSENSQEG